MIYHRTIFFSLVILLCFPSFALPAGPASRVLSFSVDGYGVAVDRQGGIHVATASGIKKYNSEGEFLTTYGAEDFLLYPTRIRLGKDGNLYAVDFYTKVVAFSPDGSFLGKHGEYGNAAGQFDHVVDLAFDDMGNVYVADSGHDRIMKFDSNWQYITQWGSPGNAPSDLALLTSLAVDDDDIVYVADYHQDNYGLKLFTSDGVFIKNTEGFENQEGPLFGNDIVHWACGFPAVCLTNTGYILGSDRTNDLVHIFPTSAFTTAQFEYVGRIGRNDSEDVNELDYPFDVCVDDNDRIYVLDDRGVFVYEWPGLETSLYRFIDPGTSSVVTLTVPLLLLN